jgi:hypothetical protein
MPPVRPPTLLPAPLVLAMHSQLVVTADDHGLVKLFNCPVVVEDAPHRAYRGHSSHVMGVRFNADDTLVRPWLASKCARGCGCLSVTAQGLALSSFVFVSE